MPAAMAPDETSTTLVPPSRRTARASTSALNRSASRPPWTPVRELEPTLTTTVPADATAARSSSVIGVDRGGIAVGPQAGLALAVQLLASLPLGVLATVERLALLGARRAAALVQAQVGAARAEQLRAGRHRRLPVEDDRVVGRADEHRGTGHSAGLEELLLHAEPAQPVGEVADRLIVGEIGLPHPPGRPVAHDAEHRVVAMPLLANAEA